MLPVVITTTTNTTTHEKKRKEREREREKREDVGDDAIDTYPTYKKIDYCSTFNHNSLESILRIIIKNDSLS